MPFPPPPAAALIMTGKPRRSADALASSGSSIGSAEPGTVGTPAACMFLRAVVFTPMASIDAGRGPMKVSRAASTARANSAFSERNP